MIARLVCVQFCDQVQWVGKKTEESKNCISRNRFTFIKPEWWFLFI